MLDLIIIYLWGQSKFSATIRSPIKYIIERATDKQKAISRRCKVSFDSLTSKQDFLRRIRNYAVPAINQFHNPTAVKATLVMAVSGSRNAS